MSSKGKQDNAVKWIQYQWCIYKYIRCMHYLLPEIYRITLIYLCASFLKRLQWPLCSISFFLHFCLCYLWCHSHKSAKTLCVVLFMICYILYAYMRVNFHWKSVLCIHFCRFSLELLRVMLHIYLINLFFFDIIP